MNLTVQHVDGMRFLATARDHTVVADAAPEDGGGGTAMSSPQLFAAAIGACILEFVANSCQIRGIPVEALSVDLVYDEVPQPRRLGPLQITIRIRPDPGPEVKQRLLAVARHATLVNTLSHPPNLEISFAKSDRSSP